MKALLIAALVILSIIAWRGANPKGEYTPYGSYRPSGDFKLFSEG